jgi:heme exporter protein B
MHTLDLIKCFFLRESLLIYRKGFEWCYPFLFFILVVLLFPLATTSEFKILQQIGPGVMWVAALLAVLLSLPRIFQADFEDGSLDQMMLSAHSLSLLIFLKVIMQWLLFVFPLLIVTPLLSVLYHLSFHDVLILELTLLLGTPILFYLGAIAAALTVGLKNSGFLLAIIILPLYIPILIFGVVAVLKSHAGMDISGEVAILGAFLLLILPISPVVSAFTLKMGIMGEA